MSAKRILIGISLLSQMREIIRVAKILREHEFDVRFYLFPPNAELGGRLAAQCECETFPYIVVDVDGNILKEFSSQKNISIKSCSETPSRSEATLQHGPLDAILNAAHKLKSYMR